MRVIRGTTQREREPPIVQWPNTGIVGRENRRQYQTLIHVTDVENALDIVKRRSITPYPERERDNALYCKPIEVVWFSPIEYADSVFGCVAFHFNWSVLHDNYGDYIYGLLPEVEGRDKYGQPTWKSRLLFSDTDLRDHFGKCYDLKADSIPWKKRIGCHYIRDGCDCQIGVTQEVSLCHLQSISFVNHKAMGGRGRNIKTYNRKAERLFLARAVSEQLPRVNGFCGVDPSTKGAYQQLLNIWWSMWMEIWHNEHFNYVGSITARAEVADALARTFLERYGRVQDRNRATTACFADDAKNIASLFRSAKDLILSLRTVIAAWAGVTETSLGSEEMGWPPWKREEKHG